ncbi:hypothetical protein AAII07_50265 [Microvirga sp. 0TCS3.31]
MKTELTKMVELTDAELDAVAAGARPIQTGAQRGLVNVQNVAVDANVEAAVVALSRAIEIQQ